MKNITEEMRQQHTLFTGAGSYTPRLALQNEDREPKWEETRTRINSTCIKVERRNINAQTFIDPKGDGQLLQQTTFMCTGQLPFGEWLKKLHRNDISPRGACSAYFRRNAHLRR